MRPNILAILPWILGLTLLTLSMATPADSIYAKDQNDDTIYDQAHRVWARSFEIDKDANTITYDAGAVRADCVPTGNQGAFLSIVLYSASNSIIRSVDNVSVVNVENASNVFSHTDPLPNKVSKNDLKRATYFVPVMRGQAGC